MKPRQFLQPQPERKEEPLREQILRVLPKTQVGLHTSIGDLIEANKLLVQYFLKAELKAPNHSEMAVQTEAVGSQPGGVEESECSEKENEQKGQKVMLITACPHSHRKHYAKVSVCLTVPEHVLLLLPKIRQEPECLGLSPH
jgi:hypothetical protein